MIDSNPDLLVCTEGQTWRRESNWLMMLAKLKKHLILFAIFSTFLSCWKTKKRLLDNSSLAKNCILVHPTGFGKSLIFQYIPLINDYLNDQAIGTTLAIVISPLQSLMLDQVEQLKKTGVSAAAVFEGQSEEILKGVENGEFSLVYSSP